MLVPGRISRYTQTDPETTVIPKNKSYGGITMVQKPC